jgi:signal transduction histidine kinase
MRKRLWGAVAAYTASVAILLSALYWFMKNDGFSENGFLLGAAGILVLSVGWGYVIVSHLIEPQRRLHEHLLHLTDDIVHELKIPLSTIQTNAVLIRKRTEDERTLKRLGRILGAAKRLEKLYKELAYALHKEIRPAQKERFDLADLVNERVVFFNERHPGRVVADTESFVVHTDRIGLEQVADNLIENALKYSPADTQVYVRLHGGVLEVADKGVGMDETELVRVFERYYRARSDKEGKGIGLALVKRFCDENDIDVDIVSKKGEGTKVSLHLHKVEKK